jgi:hypothetical protein
MALTLPIGVAIVAYPASPARFVSAPKAIVYARRSRSFYWMPVDGAQVGASASMRRGKLCLIR